MDKEYVLFMLNQRIEELKNRYRLACHGKHENGDMIISNAANVRHSTKRDLNICHLITELILNNPKPLVALSDEATEGLEKLMEPIERHRRLKNGDIL